MESGLRGGGDGQHGGNSYISHDITCRMSSLFDHIKTAWAFCEWGIKAAEAAGHTSVSGGREKPCCS